MKSEFGAGAVAATVILALTATPARAQFYAGLRGGWSNQNVTRTGGPGDLNFDSSSAFLYGAQFGLKLAALGVELVYYRAGHDLVPAGGSASSSTQEMSYHYLGINGRFGIPLPIVYPYATVGYGKYSASLAGLGEGSDSAWNAGAGVELGLGRISVFGEVRYTDFDTDIASLSWDFGGVDLQFGLNVHF